MLRRLLPTILILSLPTLALSEPPKARVSRRTRSRKTRPTQSASSWRRYIRAARSRRVTTKR